MFISVRNMTGILIEFGYIMGRINLNIPYTSEGPDKMHVIGPSLPYEDVH